MAKPNLKLFFHHLAVAYHHYHHFSFFTPCADTQFQGRPFSGGAKYTGMGKTDEFQLKLPFISETVRVRPIVAMEH